MAKEVMHVVMFPWSAFGHMMPFFQLSIALAKSGVEVSFVSTPKNIQRLPKPPSNLSTLINLVELPLPTLHNNHDLLPEGAEATVDIPFDKIQYLKIAYDLLQQPLKQFIAERIPDWIIIDALSPWMDNIAQEYHVPLMNFSVFSAATYTFFFPPVHLVGDRKRKQSITSPDSLTLVPEWVDFPSSLAYRSFEAVGVYNGFFKCNASGMSDVERVAKTFNACQAVAVRSCPEYEGEYLNLLEKLIGKPVIPVGLLAPENHIRREQITDESWIRIFQWLDEQKPRSVVFAGFGSECKLTKDQVSEMAHGLELSGCTFLLALRKPDWAADDVDALPSGFLDRTNGRGVVSIGWAPQLMILGHPSIGGSLFHSGWGSVIETLQFGHCLVVLPLIIDQPLNARILVDKGLAVEVERREDGSFTRDDIANALRLAMVSEEGEKLRVRSREAAVVFKDRKLHQHYFERFVDYLKLNVVKKEK
ncbi:hypothetical protein Ddye_017717 [Dipteronia dyeriana]|uniref:UDP-rhamnose:rhamnosyltransferase 1 n=1 Tax=Dipteronia dyeriana TaxID=168575 RepID=A0AAD9U9X5_9ROSI|nr:hypothetical protein Ddye_017717 [Dipteronia dyeriana]